MGALTGRTLLRTATTGATAALAALLCVTLTATPALAADTTTWRADGYGPANTGYNPYETQITASTLANLKQKWSVGAVTSECQDHGPPVVTGNRVYATPGDGVAAYNATTGKRVWHYTWDWADTDFVRLNLADGLLAVTGYDCMSMSDPGGRVIVLNAATGAKVWEAHPLGPAVQSLVDRGVLVVSGADTDGASVNAYRLSDGTPLWQSWDKHMLAPASANGRVLLTHENESEPDTTAELVDIVTGIAVKTFDKPYRGVAASRDGSSLYATHGADLVRLNATTGEEMWRAAGQAGLASTDGTRVYVSRDNTLQVLNAATGAPGWSWTAPNPLGKAVVAGGVAYATGRWSGGTTALVAETGAPLQGPASFGTAKGHPVVVNGRLFVATGAALTAYTR